MRLNPYRGEKLVHIRLSNGTALDNIKRILKQ
jgi:hypothetical protein